MDVRRTLPITIVVCLAIIGRLDGAKAERWSRQVSNSEWIPLANPRASHGQVSTTSPGGDSSQLPLTLPSSLQHQYQQQLLQLQKTQESIQKLLLLQQQLRAQQQLLQNFLPSQSQPILPSGFATAEDNKQALEQQGLTDLAPEVLMPPRPSSEALPPVFGAQNFFPHKSSQSGKQLANANQEYSSFPSQSQAALRQEQDNQELLRYPENEKGTEQESKGLRGQDFGPQQSPLIQSTADEEEEVQLVYVPAETLAQRGQPKRGRGRKQFPARVQQQQHHQQQQHQYQQQQQQQQQHGFPESQDAESETVTHEQDAYARQILQQIQKEHEEKAQLLKEERLREIARLNEEEKALERKNRLQQEAQQREQELQRQREAEKMRKEQERLEELAKQREMDRAREAREKQRQEELEKRRLAEIRAKEERRKEEERRREEEARQREAERQAALERQKELDLQRALKQQKILENQEREANAKAAQSATVRGETHSLPLIREQQLHRQHLTETTRPKSKVRSRQRVRTNHYQEQQQQQHREPTTTPSPNQPPLSVYMGSGSLKKTSVKVSDVLKLLKDAKTIAVLDTVSAAMPQVFVGPTNLEPPTGYSKFDLPYLSSLDHNRVERRVDKLPFFVAPLSFEPPSGYSKIPFPAPHIGSVVVNNIEHAESNRVADELDPSPTPLIEPNSYSVDSLDHKSSIATTASYDSQTTASYSQESPSSQRFEPTYPPSTSAAPSGSRFRFRQYYNENKPTAVVSTYYEDQRPSTRKHKYYEENHRASTPSLQSTKVEADVSHSDISYQSTPRYEEPLGPQVSSPRTQDAGAQLALVGQDFTGQRESQRYGDHQYHQSNSAATSGDSFGEVSLGEINDVRSAVGPTQYSLPAELPAISPHLPGLVNSLVDQQERLQEETTPTTTSTTSTTTTTTTPRPTSTTYRSRGRQRTRVTPSRSRTTTSQASSTSTTSSTRSSTTERTRRPFNRSRSRFTTTTEEYRESAYEPTKSKTAETASRYSNSEHRRPSLRKQKYRGREKVTHQSENNNIQAQQATGFDNVPQGGPSGAGAAETFLSSNEPSAPEVNPPRQEHSLAPPTVTKDFQENYPQTTVATTENYPTLPVSHETSYSPNDYTKNPSFSQTGSAQDLHYHEMYNNPATAFEQPSLEKTPVNGFNYQAQQNDESREQQPILPRPKEYLPYQGKLDSDFELPTTEDPRTAVTDEQHRYSSIYDVNVPRTQPEYAITGQAEYHSLDSEKLGAGVLVDTTANEPPIFVPLPASKQQDYELRVSSTEAPLTDATTQSSTAGTTPVIIRQRVRGRIGGRVHQDSAVQTRPRGSQDEYVRFSIVNHDSTRSSSGGRHRESSKSRARNRPQSHASHIQTEGADYIRIQPAHHQKLIATTTPRPTTTTSTQPPQVVDDDDADYGFIRTPNFQPVHPAQDRLTTPVTYRPQVAPVQSQSLLGNDGAQLEFNQPQTQLLKNRPKYQQAPNRRPPVSKATTLPSSDTSAIETITTTERTPAATTLPDDSTLFTARPKSRTDEPKHSRIRSRNRRPAKKRVTTTTSTTESVLETHNELPLDENYPRIPPSLPSAEQQPLFEENYESPANFPAIRTGSNQYYEPTSENYPAQEFILNFGNLPEEVGAREEYDQTQLASNPPGKYSHASLVQPSSSEDSQSSPSDIYGAESQWSTKLTSTSFQPSFVANRVAEPRGKSHKWSQYTENVPEIITAGPDVSSVTFLVSSDLNNNEGSSIQDVESSLMGTTTFGKKTGASDHTEQLNATTAFTNAPTTLAKLGTEAADTVNTQDLEPWLMDSSTEALTTIDLERTTKRNPETVPAKKANRRRRVRVRVRPASDDFVTAESQHINSAVNSLIQEHYKFSPVRESKTTTPEPMTTTTSQRSALQDFLEEILKDDETVSVRATSTTTELPEDMWTASTPMTTLDTTFDKIEESTSTDNQFSTVASVEMEREGERSTTHVTPITVRSYVQGDAHLQRQQSLHIPTNPEDLEDRKKIYVEKKEGKKATKDDHKKATKSEDQIYETTQTSLSTSSRLSTQPLGAQTTEELDMSTKQVKFPKNDEEMKTFSKMIDEMERTKSLKSNQVPKDEGDHDHPKNHRAHWSEVRHPSELDPSEIPAWNQETKPNASPEPADTIPGTVTKTEGNNNVRTISDYVRAIFDSMKSAEEESQATTTTDKPSETTTVSITDNRDESEVQAVQESIVTRIEMSSTSKSKKSGELGPTTKLHPSEEVAKESPTTTTESSTRSPEQSDDVFTTSAPSATTPIVRSTDAPANSTQSALGKVLRTSTTTKVSHMTEICYRGRCVMTRPKQDDRSR